MSLSPAHTAPAAVASGRGASAVELAAGQWAALHDAARAVAALAGLPALANAPADLPGAMSRAGGWRERMAGQAIADLAAMMQPGVAALLAVNASGRDASAPALALIGEFEEARAAILRLLLVEPAPAPGR